MISQSRFYICTVLLAALIFTLTAYYSSGYYQADEHYQIIEFASAKLGNIPMEALPWEYEAHIRPTLQPSIAVVVLGGLEKISVTDPYLQAFMLRLLAAFLALTCIHFFIKQTEQYFKDDSLKKAYYLLSYFLWFIPLLSVRFSSETLSGLMFLTALSFCFRHGKRTPLYIGLFLGLSFLFRFQMAIPAFGLFGWLLVIRKEKPGFFLQAFGAFLAILLIGAGIDCWFYQDVVFTPWNYFYVTILDHAAPAFGVSPWHYYFTQFLSYPSYFLGIPLVISFLIIVLKYPRLPYIWVMIPFILIHSLIPHKEQRFMFPLVFFFAFIMLYAYQYLNERIRPFTLRRGLAIILAVIFIIVNSIGLLAMAQKSAGLTRIGTSHFIHTHYANKPLHIIHPPYANPYRPWGDHIPTTFYAEKDIIHTEISSLCELDPSVFKEGRTNLVVVKGNSFYNKECTQYFKQFEMPLLFSSLPDWIKTLNEYYRGYGNEHILYVYQYDKNAIE